LLRLTVGVISVLFLLWMNVGLVGPPPILLEYNKLPLLNKSVPSVKKRSVFIGVVQMVPNLEFDHRI
jgi:hypothetical protein